MELGIQPLPILVGEKTIAGGHLTSGARDADEPSLCLNPLRPLRELEAT